MADQDRRDAVGIDAPFADRHHRRGAAIDQDVAAVGACEMEAGVEAAAAAEGVTRAEELKAHSPTLPRPGPKWRGFAFVPAAPSRAGAATSAVPAGCRSSRSAFGHRAACRLVPAPDRR